MQLEQNSENRNLSRQKRLHAMKTETTRMLCNEIKERKEIHSMKTNENRDMRQSKRTICNENREREEY